MKPVSTWVVLGMSLFLVLNREAIAEPGVIGHLIISIDSKESATLNSKAPTTPTATQIKPQNASPTIPIPGRATTPTAFITQINLDQASQPPQHISQDPLRPATPNELNSLSNANDPDIAILAH